MLRLRLLATGLVLHEDLVWLESDAESVVNKIVGKHQSASPIFHFYYDIFALSSLFSSFRCSHVRRLGNTVAQLVARWEALLDSKTIYVGSFPQSLIALAELDLV